MPPNAVIHSLVRLIAGIKNSSTTLVTIGRNVSPTEMPNSLSPEVSFFTAPSNDPRRVSAMSWATSPDSFIFLSRAVNAGIPAALNPLIARAPSVPNISNDCCVVTDLSSSCVRILLIGSILPRASTKVNPSFAASLAASLLGLIIARNAELSDEPPMLPAIPALASNPRAVAVSSKLTPAAAAVGPTILNASPICPTSVLALREACASLSTTPSKSPTFMPIPERMLVDISAACPSSMPAAEARLKVPGRAAMIWSVVKPAMPRNWIPSAAEVAEWAVVAPISRASFSSASNSAPVAPVIAETSAIDCSNSRA